MTVGLLLVQLIAALTSALVLLIARVAKNQPLSKLVTLGIGTVVLVGALATYFCPLAATWLRSNVQKPVLLRGLKSGVTKESYENRSALAQVEI